MFSSVQDVSFLSFLKTFFYTALATQKWDWFFSPKKLFFLSIHSFFNIERFASLWAGEEIYFEYTELRIFSLITDSFPLGQTRNNSYYFTPAFLSSSLDDFQMLNDGACLLRSEQRILCSNELKFTNTQTLNVEFSLFENVVLWCWREWDRKWSKHYETVQTAIGCCLCQINVSMFFLLDSNAFDIWTFECFRIKYIKIPLSTKKTWFIASSPIVS